MLRGEAGVGKTALLSFLVAWAAGCQVVTASDRRSRQIGPDGADPWRRDALAAPFESTDEPVRCSRFRTPQWVRSGSDEST